MFVALQGDGIAVCLAINSMKSQTTKKGNIGEDLACAYLVKKGYKIIVRNYRKKFGEIDIIGRERDGTLVFIEVKALFEGGVGSTNLSPEDNLTSAKLVKFKKICAAYANRHPDLINDKRGWRMDLLAIKLKNAAIAVAGLKDCEISHYENIS